MYFCGIFIFIGMNKVLRSAIALVLFAAFGVPSLAQDGMKAGYFLEGYSHRYKMNPALAPERGFFNPVIGSTGIDASSNLKLTNLMWKDENGNLNSILAANTPADLAQLPDGYGLMDVNINSSLLSAGWWNRKATVFQSIDLGVRATANSGVSQGLLDLFREHSPISDYSMDPMNIGLNSMAEIAYGLTIKKSWFHFGLRAKLLVGLANVNFSSDEMQLKCTTPGEWKVTGQAVAEYFVPGGIDIPTKGDIDPLCPANRRDYLKFRDLNYDAKRVFPIPGIGGAVDLGLGLDFGQYVSFYAGVNDLGYMSWNHGKRAVSPGSSWTAQAYSGIIDATLGIKDQGEIAMDLIDEIFPFVEEKDVTVKYGEMLPLKINGGLNVKMPFYEAFQVGVASTATMANSTYTSIEGRLISSITLGGCFDIAADYSYTHPFGHSVGLLLNLHVPGINFFVGTDSLIPVFAWKYGLPTTKFNTSAHFGLNVTFGKKH